MEDLDDSGSTGITSGYTGGGDGVVGIGEGHGEVDEQGWVELQGLAPVKKNNFRRAQKCDRHVDLQQNLLLSRVGGAFHRGFPPPKPVACCCYLPYDE